MTDGHAYYPTEGIKDLKKLKEENPYMLYFAGIEFKNKQPMMGLIADELQGKSHVAFNPEQLTSLFIQSIQVIKYNEQS